MTMAMTRADHARQAAHQVGARVRAAHYHQLAEQRRFVLAIDAEVRGSIEVLYEKYCEAPIKEAIAQNAHFTLVDIPTRYGDEEPIRPEFSWKPGVRCKAILKHLQAYIRDQGFAVREGELYTNWNPPGKSRGQICMHAIPLTISW